MILRTSSHTIKFANTGKKVLYKKIVSDYQWLLQKYIDLIYEKKLGSTEGDILTLYEKENGQIIVVTDDKFYNQMRVEAFNDLLSFKKEFFKPDEKFSWFSIKNFKWFKESLLRKKVLPEEIKEL